MRNTYTVWMGYDPREDLAYRVARHSILSRTDPQEVNVVPISLENEAVSSILTRPIKRKDGKLWCPISQAPMATEFAISRFCVPFLQKSGWALFVDCDLVCFSDIRELFGELRNEYAVLCVKREPTEPWYNQMKMDGQIQTFYARKNWSSVMAINMDHPANQRLTLQDLNSRPGRDLHAFFWLKDEEIGGLNPKWNTLVNVDDMGGKLFSGIWHYTLGGEWIPGWKPAPFDMVWRGAKEEMESSCKSTDSAKAASYG